MESLLLTSKAGKFSPRVKFVGLPNNEISDIVELISSEDVI